MAPHVEETSLQPPPAVMPPRKAFGTATDSGQEHKPVNGSTTPLLDSAMELDRSMAKITLNDNRHRRGFFDLSAELRNKIYELALIKPDERAITIPVVDIETYDDNHVFKCETMVQTHLLQREPYLLLVCRQTRKEALPIYYGGNAFQCENRAGFIKWLTHLGAHKRSLLRKLQGFAPWVYEKDPNFGNTLQESLSRVLAIEEDFAAAGTGIEKGVFRFTVRVGTGVEFWSEGQIRAAMGEAGQREEEGR